MIVKPFYKEPTAWVPQTTLSAFYYNLTTQLCQTLFNKGLLHPSVFLTVFLIITQLLNFVKCFLTRGFELSPLNLVQDVINYTPFCEGCQGVKTLHKKPFFCLVYNTSL
jgi:hypothetical protein